jgi:hypothetical protein
MACRGVGAGRRSTPPSPRSGGARLWFLESPRRPADFGDRRQRAGFYGIGAITRSIHTRIEFYAVVVQLMPVLMLVAAVNGRYFRERDDAPPFDRFLIRGFWVVGLVGIAAALAVVARGRDSVLLRGAVIYSLALIGVLVTVYAIHGPARDADATQGGSGKTGEETD